jgi:glutathione synthase
VHKLIFRFRNIENELYLASVVYFRAGYSPDDYPTEAEWDARLLIEQSSAIKAPSIGYHLAGTKRVQQRLAEPNIIES